MSENPRRSDIVEKWGERVAARGFTQIPNYLMQINHFLDKEHRLTPVEILVLLQLVAAWWKTNDKPFPSMGTLAPRCGVSERQIQRAINRLEKLGFLKREKRRSRGIIASNAYSLAPLVSLLSEVAKHFPAEFPRKISSAQVNAITKSLILDKTNRKDESEDIEEDSEILESAHP